MDRTVERHLIDIETGQVVDLRLTVHQTGGAFVKLWLGKGWQERLLGLRGSSVKILHILESMVQYGNAVPTPSGVARQIGLTRQAVSRAYQELLNADILRKVEHQYMFNPLFCWRGTAKGYELALRDSVRRALPVARRQLAEGRAVYNAKGGQR